MNSLLSSLTKDSMFSNIVNFYSKVIKDTFGHIRGKLGELPNQRRERVAIDMFNLLLKNMSR